MDTYNRYKTELTKITEIDKMNTKYDAYEKDELGFRDKRRYYLSNLLEYLRMLGEGGALTPEQTKDQQQYSNQLFPGAKYTTTGQVYQEYLKWLKNPASREFLFKDEKKQNGFFKSFGPDYSSEPTIAVFGGKRKSTTCKGTVYNVGGKDFCVGEKSSSKKYGTKKTKKHKKLGTRSRKNKRK